MEEEYKQLLDSMRLQLESHPFVNFKKGDQKKLILKNASLIKKASVFFTQKTVVERLANDLNIDIRYDYVNKVMKKYESQPELTSTFSNEPVSSQPAIAKEKEGNTEKIQQEVKQDEITDSLGRKPYPVDDDITPEKVAEWDHLKLPRFAVRKLISFRISIEEWKSLNYTIKSADSINAYVANYCQQKEDDWLESQRK